MPRTLFGRAAVILLLPILTLQLAVAVIFIQRHFEDVTEQMTRNLVLEIDFVLDELETRSLDDVIAREGDRLGLTIQLWDGQSSGNKRIWYDISGLTLIPALYSNLSGVRDVDLSDVNWVTVALESPIGPITIYFDRDRVSASNPHQLLVLMVFTGIFMTLLAFVFMRAQLRPIKTLAEVAEAFGRGQVQPLRVRGAIEVRAAARSFLEMRDRIDRQIEQRTMMLSGVSHDLRTPMTRLQLGLEMMDPSEDVTSLKKDVQDMTAMLDAYLTYAKDAAAEPVSEVDLAALVEDLCDRAVREMECTILGEAELIGIRQLPIQRAIENLISNALKYGSAAKTTVTFGRKRVVVTVEDDGPGIAPDDRAAALRPFVRLDPARNQNKVSGVGLGLAIAADAVKAQGGILTLSDSDMGGLKAEINLPKPKAAK